MSAAPDSSQAADWFAQMRSGEPDPEGDAAWAEWLAAGEKQQKAYENCELAWELCAQLQHRPAVRNWLGEADRLLNTAAPARPRWRPPLRQVGLAASLIAAGVLIYALHARPVISAYATQVGEQRVVMLPDRSSVSLNTDTQLRVRYSAGMRRVELLRGEALFSVAKDAARPFEVHALRGVTTAVGTQFDVEINGTAASVEVLEGTVTVGASETAVAAARVAVPAGKSVGYTREGAVSDVQQADLERIRAWRSQRLVFNDIPLAQALKEYNRYTAAPIVLRDAALGARHVNGVFRIGDRAAFLDALKQGLHLSVTLGNSQTVLQAQ